MSVEVVEISGKAKTVITNTVRVTRTAAGMTVTVNAPEIHAWLRERCVLGSNPGVPRVGWPREGQVLARDPEKPFQFPDVLRQYSTDYLFLDEGINLSILRHEKAAEGPVSFTTPGMYTYEQWQDCLAKAQSTLASLYRDHMRECDGTATVKVVR